MTRVQVVLTLILLTPASLHARTCATLTLSTDPQWWFLHALISSQRLWDAILILWPPSALLQRHRKTSCGCQSGSSLWSRHSSRLSPLGIACITAETPTIHTQALVHARTLRAAALHVWRSMWRQQSGPLCLQYAHVDGVAAGQTLGWIHGAHLSTAGRTLSCPLVIVIGCNDTPRSVPAAQLFCSRSFF